MANAAVLVFLLFLVVDVHGNRSIATRGISNKAAISLHKRYDGLMRELVNLLAEQKNERKTLMKRCKDAENTTKKFSIEIEATKRSMDHFRKETARQHTDTQKQIHAALRTLKDINSLIKQHSSQLMKMQNQMTAIQQAKATRQGIGFSVKFKWATIGSISFGNKDIVKFNKIISNYGNGYNISTGKFTCKTPGLYFFTCTLISKTNHGAVWIVKNKTNIIEALTIYEFPRVTKWQRYQSGSSNTVLRLSAGDEVWISPKSLSGSVNVEFGSSFSGLLISE